MLREYMLELGFTESDIGKILSAPSVVSTRKSTLLRKTNEIFDYFISIGYSDKQIIKMIKLHPQLLGYAVENIKLKIDGMMKLGCSLPIIIKMTVGCPQIFSLSIENVDSKIREMLKIGYSYEEIAMMASGFASIYTLTIENIKNKINGLMMLGYTLEQVIQMTVVFPQIFSLSIENLTEKIEFYKSLGLGNIILINPKLLMQSVDLSYARYMYYTSRGVTIDINNYLELFVAEKKFLNSNGLTNAQVIDLYKYNRENKSNSKTRVMNLD